MGQYILKSPSARVYLLLLKMATGQVDTFGNTVGFSVHKKRSLLTYLVAPVEECIFYLIFYFPDIL